VCEGCSRETRSGGGNESRPSRGLEEGGHEVATGASLWEKEVNSTTEVQERRWQAQIGKGNLH